MRDRVAVLGPLPADLAEALATLLAAEGWRLAGVGAPHVDLAIAGRAERHLGPFDPADHTPEASVVGDVLSSLLAFTREVTAGIEKGRGVLMLVAEPLAIRPLTGRALDSVIDAGVAMLGQLAAVDLAPAGARCVVAACDGPPTAQARAILSLAATSATGAVVPLGDVSTAALFADRRHVDH